MRTALITGSAGFIGRHFARALDDAGYDITGIDIADGDDARDFFRRDRTSYDLVIHAAAVVGGRRVIDGQPLEQAVNFELDAGLFQWALLARPGRVVYFSSPAAYPVILQRYPGPGLAEDAINLRYPQQPDALYGWIKLTGERLAALACEEGLRVTVVRPFSGYGEDQSTDYPFAAIAERANLRRDPLKVWGSGDQVRDWVHVDDIVAAVMTMASLGVDGPVNIGTGTGTSMIQLAGLFAEVCGYGPVIQPRPEAPSGVAHRVADTALLNQFYTPTVSLEEGVKRIMAYLAD